MGVAVLRLGRAVALALGFFLGNRVGRLAISARVRSVDTAISANVFLGMALVSLSYVGAELLEAWGFLAAFAAGVGLRHAEIRSSGGSEVPAEEGTVLKAGLSDDGLPVSIEYGEDRREHRKIAVGTLIVDILSFGGLLERALEVVLAMILGATLSACWDWRGVWLALALFCLVRPLACWLLLPRTGLDRWQRLLVGWFGVRGIGSLYYLCFALDHGVEGAAAREAMGISLTVVACSLLLHGLSTQPLLDLYEARQRRAGQGSIGDEVAAVVLGAGAHQHLRLVLADQCVAGRAMDHRGAQVGVGGDDDVADRHFTVVAVQFDGAGAAIQVDGHGHVGVLVWLGSLGRARPPAKVQAGRPQAQE